MAPGREKPGSGCQWSIPGAGESQGNRKRKGKGYGRREPPGPPAQGSPVPEREPRSQWPPARSQWPLGQRKLAWRAEPAVRAPPRLCL